MTRIRTKTFLRLWLNEKPVRQIIDLLQADVSAAVALRQTALAQVQTVRLKLYNEARKKASPAELLAMMDEITKLSVELQTVQTVQVDELFKDMKSAHEALVTFAKSDKSPKNLSELASRIDVFAQHAALVANVINSIRSAR